MHRTPGAGWLGAAMGVWLAAAGCRTMREPYPAPPPSPSAEATRRSVAELVAAPSVRVGILVGAPRVSIGAASGLVVYGRTVQGDGPASREVSRATLMPVDAGTPTADRFRVQVASLSAEAGAQNLAARVEATVQARSSVQWNASTGTHQVRAGGFATRDEAGRLATRLSRSGLPGAYVVEEPGTAVAGRMWLLETGEELAVATVVPAQPGALLTADGAPYRGVLEVRTGGDGTLTVVNVVNIEDYLRGVVPNELSPMAFPQMEALKAQAVAARSYVLDHRGDYSSRGFDICATPACQVYRGQATEHPTTDRAVQETRGVIASWRGRPINAYYTSTCGGHTEDSQNVFDGREIPYLKGVACAPEGRAGTPIRTTVRPREVGSEPGLGRAVALLGALRVLDPSLEALPRLSGVPADAELREWVGRLNGALQHEGCEPAVSGALARRGTFAQYLVGSLCWEERGRRLVAPPELDDVLKVEDRASLRGEGERLAAAVLLREGVLSPFPDNTLRPGAALTRAEAVLLLARAAEKAAVPGLVSAEFAGAAAGQITILRGEEHQSFGLDPAARLFRSRDGVRSAVSELRLAMGDRVNLVVADGRVVFVEAEQTGKSAEEEGSSRHYRWQVRLTPAEVAGRLERYGEVGKVLDLVPRRMGVSGRVVELAVQGNAGEVVLKGLRIRGTLGLRENLFVIQREANAKGAVQRFVITGKGWGHGVGLCQVGAFGMAQSGSTYEQILKHYYTGIRLERAY